MRVSESERDAERGRERARERERVGGENFDDVLVRRRAKVRRSSRGTSLPRHFTALRIHHSATRNRQLRLFNRCSQFTQIGHVPEEFFFVFAGGWSD